MKTKREIDDATSGNITTVGVSVPARIGDASLVRARRLELIETATELFLENGYHSTTVRQIASAAGWTMGSLYSYVTSKSDVLFLIMRHIAEELTEELAKAQRFDSAEETFMKAAQGYMLCMDRLRREVRLLYRESASLEPDRLRDLKRSEIQQRQQFEKIFQRGVDSREFRNDVDVVLMAQTFLMLGAMWPLKKWALQDYVSLQQYTDQQCELILGRLRG